MLAEQSPGRGVHHGREAEKELQAAVQRSVSYLLREGPLEMGIYVGKAAEPWTSPKAPDQAGRLPMLKDV